MHAALNDFLAQVRAIEKTLELRDYLVVFGQYSAKNYGMAAVALRRSVRDIGLSGMQPSLDGSVLLLAAAFEQFISDVMIAYTANLPNIVPQYRNLRKAIRSANEQLTGDALNNNRSRFESFELQRFVSNLRDCQAGVVPYVLNGEAMALNNRNLDGGQLKELFGRLGIPDIWEQLGSTRTLQRWSGHGGATAARFRAQNHLHELIRNRNQIAHRVGQTKLGPEVVRSYIRFERALAKSLVKSLEGYAKSL